jgi:hypothetical protein
VIEQISQGCPTGGFAAFLKQVDAYMTNANADGDRAEHEP